MNSWLIPVRTDKYDFERAFAELENNCIDQHANRQFERGDVVYLYCAPDGAIKYKCVIVKTDIPQAESINDGEYMLDKSFFAQETNTPGKCIRLQFLEAVDIPLASLRANGLTRPLNLQQEIKDDDILRYLNSVTGNHYADETIDETVDKTETMQLCAARIGQGRFRQKVIALDKKCIVTGVDDIALLNASHIKAWSESTNDERLDGNNGILLSPHLDKLFDKHLISFSDDGEILVFDENIRKILDKWNIDRTKKYGQFSEKRKAYLEHHRKIARDKKNGNGISEPELFQSKSGYDAG